MNGCHPPHCRRNEQEQGLSEGAPTPRPELRESQKHDPAGMRGDYSLPGAGLLEQDLLEDPMAQFDKWYNHPAKLLHPI